MSDVRPVDGELTSNRSPRSRGGNAMGRSRAAALDGARRVFAENGIRKASMADVAVRGGLAKATLYNHFRTKSELVAGLVLDDVADLAQDCVDLAKDDAVVALTRAADAVATNPVFVGLRIVEPTALLAAVAPGDGPVWDGIRTQVERMLDAANLSSHADCVDLVCRWLASFVTAPGSSAVRSAQAGLLASSLPAAIRTTAFATPAVP